MNCLDCAYCISSNCTLLGGKVSALKGCPYHSSVAYRCEFCGKYLIPEQVIITDNKFVCESCLALLSTCRGCRNSITACRFAKDSSVTEPFYTVQTQRVSGGQVQRQIKNPARIEKTCKLCKCFNGETCGRDYDYCANHT